MSKTQSIAFGGRHLWAFDASLAVWLAWFVLEWERRDRKHMASLESFVAQARLVATIGDYGLDLDALLGPLAIEPFTAIARDVTQQIRVGGPISAASVAAIHLLDGMAPIRRGPELLDPEPIARVGDAIVGLLDGSLVRPPSGTWWCVGTADPAATIATVPHAPPG